MLLLQKVSYLTHENILAVGEVGTEEIVSRFLREINSTSNINTVGDIDMLGYINDQDEATVRIDNQPNDWEVLTDVQN